MLWSFVALLALAKGSNEELIQPDELILSGETTWLTVKPCNWTIENVVKLQTRCYCYEYNGVSKCSVPGPTLVFTNGTKGYIRLQNSLTGSTALDLHAIPAMDMMSHDPDVTNLHVHGLHVDPAIDDVIERLVEPNSNEFLDYNFSIPSDHYPGLHWYHDHWHGTVTYHVHTGLFGAIRVNRENNLGIDANLAAMKSRVVVLHGLSLNRRSLYKNGTCNCEGYVDFLDKSGPSNAKNPIGLGAFHLTTVCDQWCDMYCFQRLESATPPIQTFAKNWETSNAIPADALINWNDGITLLLVNGQIQPKITIETNEWVRLELANADAQGAYFLNFNNTECEHYLIATDGIFFDAARDMAKTPYNNTVFLTMGSRAEVLVKCSQPGTYEVYTIPNHPDKNIQKKILCTPAYNETVKLFTLSVNSSDAGDTFNASTLTFPPKVGYVADTVNTNEPVNHRPQCVNYNASGVNNITWQMDPDPIDDNQCSVSAFNLPKFGLQNITGKIYGINGQYFRHDKPLAILLPDQIYEFIITFFPHPFHHHINPYQLQHDVGGGFLAQKGDWRDVLSPGCANGGTVFARSRTLDFIGKVVMHCHYLPHEDRGLMGFYVIANVSSCNNTGASPIPSEPDRFCNRSVSDLFCSVLPVNGAHIFNFVQPIVISLLFLFGIQFL